jgi:hypothetical protein
VKVEKKDKDGKTISNEEGGRYHTMKDIGELKEEILNQSILCIVEDYGGVRLTFNDHDKSNELDVDINIYVGEY